MRKSSKQPRTFGRTKAKQRPQQKDIIASQSVMMPIEYIDLNVGMELFHRIKQRHSDLFRMLVDM